MGTLTRLASRLETAWGALRARPDPSPRRDLPRHLIADALHRGLYSQGLRLRDSEFDELQAYVETAWVYAPVFRIATSLASVPFRIYRGDPEGDYDLVDPNDPARRALHNPNWWQSRYDLWFDTALFLELKGQAPWACEGTPDRLTIVALRPDLFAAVPGKDTFVSEYRYGKMGEVRYAPEEIVHLRWRHPKDDYGGLGSVRPASDAVVLDERAKEYNRAVLDNRGSPGGWLEIDKDFFDSAPMSDAQLQELATKWAHEFQGAKNAGRVAPAVGYKYHEDTHSPRDLEFMAGRKENRTEILSAFGVPPSLVGWMETSIRANAETQKRSFWEDTMVPKLCKIEEDLNSPDSGFFWRFGPEYFGKFELAGITALQENANDKALRWFRGVELGLVNKNEARAEVFGLDAVPELEVFYQPPSAVGGLFGEPAMEPGAGRLAGRSLPTRSVRLLRDDLRRTAHWKLLAVSWNAEERAWARGMLDYFEAQEARIMRRLGNAPNVERLSADQLIPLEEEQEALRDVVGPLILGTVKQGGFHAASLIRRTFRDRGKMAPRARAARAVVVQGEEDDPESFEFDPLSPEVRAMTLSMEQKLVRKIEVNRWARLREALVVGQAAGDNVLDLMDRIRGELQTWRSEFEIQRIARTEVIKASNGGALESYKQSGVVQASEWLTSRDAAVRDSHAELEGDVAPLGGQFKNGLQYPGDPAGAPEESINCRCTTVPVIEGV